jgi:hypothetical protein
MFRVEYIFFFNYCAGSNYVHKTIVSPGNPSGPPPF